MFRYLSVILSGWLALASSSLLAEEKPVDFNRDIRPLLSNHCFACHGPDQSQRQAGLRLDTFAGATGKLESGSTAVLPGEADGSELLRRVAATEDAERMPPAGKGKPLSPEEIKLLTRWINQGAKYEQHWAFVKPERPDPPQVTNDHWTRNEIDHFVLAKLEKAGRQPAAEATKEILLRRVAFDLTGLPPTLEELDQFLSDESPDAYEKMVDHYLALPAYGEQMARHWLDLARYADSNGYQYDTERQQWVWRDWVIDAYNRNLPFDQFTIEQLAGDLLPNATPQQRLATGFNRNHSVTIEGGVIDEEYRTEYVMDRLLTTGTVWMGLTVGCARCHDHKFDPLSQKEFYQLFAYFNQVPERGLNGFAPKEVIPSPLAAEQQKSLHQELAALKVALQEPDKQLLAKVEHWAAQLAAKPTAGWSVLTPQEMNATGGSKLTKLEDNSILVGGANPAQETYEISAQSDAEQITAIRLEALTHESLPGGGPGRHSNSNFVLSEFELVASSLENPELQQAIKFTQAIADYSQASYEVALAIDGNTKGNNGWAVDGPTRKEPATAMFIAEKPFGYPGGTRLQFLLRHEANFATHGIGRPRLSFSTDPTEELSLQGVPAEIVEIAKKSKDARSAAEQKKLVAYYSERHPGRQQQIESRIAEIEKQIDGGYPATMIMQELPQPRATHLLNRGQYNEPQEQVSPGVPAVLPDLPAEAPTNRLGFAQWLVSPEHPLTARVEVNRYWQRLFGLGLVKTAEDFGIQGELPSHPDLLDWLATEFIRSGWDTKHMLRLMVTSATYRQTSAAGKAAYEQDPENRLLARGPRMRLSAEEIRDAALSVSGQLVQKIGGPSVYPYQPAGLWTELNNRPGYSQEYEHGHGDDLYRRSLYSFWKRSVTLPMFKTFDAPDREVCTMQRSRTNTPLQALLLVNGPQYVEAARHLGERMLQSEGTDADRLTLGFRLVTSRHLEAAELALLKEHLTVELARFKADPAAARKLLSVGESEYDTTRDVAELAAWASVARLLMNLDEFITKG